MEPQGGQCICNLLSGALSGAMNESQLISSLRGMNLGDDFWMYSFKARYTVMERYGHPSQLTPLSTTQVTPCQRSYSHKWTLCPCAHAGETARRRDPRLHAYKAILCPVVKQKRTCPLGDSCMWSHSIFEHWLHPSRYKTRLCSFGRNCNRPICFFAHHSTELRLVSGSEDVPKELNEREYLLQLVLAQESGMLPLPTDQAEMNHQLLMQQQQSSGPKPYSHPPYPQHAPNPSFGPSNPSQVTPNLSHLYPPPGLIPPLAPNQGSWGGFPSSSSSAGINSNQNMQGNAGTSSIHHHQQQLQQAMGMGEGEVDTTSMLLGLQDTIASMSLLDASQWPIGAVSGAPHGRISDPGHVPRPPPQPMAPSPLSHPPPPGSNFSTAGRSSFGGAVTNLGYNMMPPPGMFDFNSYQHQQQQEQQHPVSPQRLANHRASVSEGGDSLNLGLIPGLEDLLPLVLRQIQAGDWEGLGISAPEAADTPHNSAASAQHVSASSKYLPPPNPNPNPYQSSPNSTLPYQSSNLMINMPSFGSSAESASARSSAPSHVDAAISPISGMFAVGDVGKRSSETSVRPSSSSTAGGAATTSSSTAANVSATDALMGRLVHQLQEQGTGSKDQLVASLTQLLAQLLEPGKEKNKE